MKHYGEIMISKLIKLPIESVVCRPQVRRRFDDASIFEIAESAKQVGIQTPILVWKDGQEWVLIDGAVRLRAAKEAGETTILAGVLDGTPSRAETIQLQLAANKFVELCVTDKAQAAADFIREAACSASEAAAKLAIEPGTLSKLLSIASVSPDVQELIDRNGWGLSKAYQISIAGNEEAQRRLALELASGAITRDGAAAKLARKHKSRKSMRKGSRNGCERIAVALGDGRSVSIAGPGMTLASVIEWLTGLVERLRTAHGQSLELSDAIKMVAQP
jgi:ParB/RepB/Spo0J family partition protein